MRRCLVVLLLVVSLTGPALADSPQTGTIDGKVVDASGSALPGVTVTLGSDRGERSAITDEEGKFLFGILPPGAYTLRATLEGFEPAERAVPLETGQRQTVELKLGLGTAEEIAVVAEVALVDKYQVSASTTIEAAVARELAFTNRNYQSLITSLPGVVHSDQSTQLAEIMPSVNGGLWQENAAFVDGVDTTNSRYGGGSRMVLPTSALSEVKSDASGYGAEYGRTVGGVTGVVTKSGTNNFHGDFQYIAQNQKWEAQSDAVPLDREDDIIDSYEAAIGGPIVRDKFWFFLAAGDNSTNQISSLAGGDLIDNSVTTESFIGKLNFNPSPRHSLVGTYIDAPSVAPFFATNYADRLTVSNHDLGGDFATASWSWTAADNAFLEVRGAQQESSESRTPIETSTPVAGVSPDMPAGNQGAYWDAANTFRWHASGLPLGPGVLEFPRDQGNVALTWFLDRNELKFGVDYQDVSWESLNQVPDRYQGRNYNPSLPGGFVIPLTKNVYRKIDSPVETTSTNLAAFAQDRIEVGDHWTFSLGVRYEDQAHDNDVGQEVLSSTDFTPRLAAIYDINGDGGLLVKATAGRYLTHITQELVNAEFSTLPNGANVFDQYSWNRVTERYDIFVRTNLPAAANRVVDLDPYFKDEVTGGFEWQMSPKWALDVRGIWWKIDEPYSATDQFNAQGQVFRLLTNFEQAEREYEGVQIEANRAFRDGWLVRTNYTWSKVEGNAMGQEHFNNTIDDFLEAMTILDAATGLPVTAVNRYGRLDNDRTHIANLSAAKSFDLTERQRFTLGGWFTYRTGKPWGLRPTVFCAASPPRCTPTAPTGVATIATTRYAQPRDANELEDTYALNLTAAWEFPIAGRVEGSLRAEAANVTDEQEQIAVSLATGQPIAVRQSYQKPRELRAVVGVRF
jgi:TonB dependent receptor/Carboxypeptidase regulatory-like domain